MQNCQTIELLDCWIVGLLDCWTVGLLDCRTVENIEQVEFEEVELLYIIYKPRLLKKQASYATAKYLLTIYIFVYNICKYSNFQTWCFPVNGFSLTDLSDCSVRDLSEPVHVNTCKNVQYCKISLLYRIHYGGRMSYILQWYSNLFDITAAASKLWQRQVYIRQQKATSSTLQLRHRHYGGDIQSIHTVKRAFFFLRVK